MSKNIGWLKEIPFAHRGLYNEIIPENSMGAFRNAIKYGYGIELDVQYTKDKKIVIFHDNALYRMTGYKGNVNDLTYLEINKLTLLNTNERIPLFKDVINLIDERVPLLVEIKKSKDYINLSKDVYNTVKDYKGKYSIQSFDPRIVSWYKQHAKEVIRGQLSFNFKESSFKWYEKIALKDMIFNFYSKPDYICYGIKGINSLEIKILRKKKPIISWTIKNENEMKFAYKYSDNIIFEGFIPKNIKKG
ncbi:glycerophosphodiester phosphodiesterase family protein [Romboutsia lituseburensis]|uniref:glycerophosphodiester phosphodiesterase family protein n=1 Tax=Romboutsia lituseburensis TaxID=1537 RepID=UPI00215A7843|nr:glycerophosphodiester phosphodiesterase family protein [Romboutsia lituseburensis]MCR8744733.1 glycerophosphodiester phosphodiesterase [Romboutsia lituseburensis]